MKNLTPPWRGAGGLLLAACAALSLSTLFSAIKPVLLTRFVEEAGFSQSLSSLLVAAPFLGIAAASLLLGGVIQRLYQRISYRNTCWLLGMLLVACEGLSGLYPALAMLVLAAQFITGVCAGLLIGITAQQIAQHPQRHGLFGIMDMSAVLLMSFMMAGAGWAVQQQGLAGGFTFALVCAALLVATMFAYRPNRETQTEPIATTIAGVSEQVSREFHWLPIILIAMGILFITFSGLGYTYMFTLAKQLGLSYDSAGQAIGFILFGSSFACLLGGWCSARFGPTKPLLAAYITCALSWWMVFNAQHANLFLLALVPAICALQFAFPILLSLYGSLDKQGRWAAIAAPLLTSGFAWAAIVAGLVVEYLGVNTLPIATALGMAGCVLLLLLGQQLRLGTHHQGLHNAR